MDNNKHNHEEKDYSSEQQQKSWKEIVIEYLHGDKFKLVLVVTALIGIILGYAATRTFFIQFNASNTVGEAPVAIKKAPKEIASGSANASGSKYIVLVGQLSDKNMIDKISLDLQSQGYQNKIVSRNNAYTINLGEFSDRAKAETLSKELEDKGYPAFIDTAQ